MPFSGVEMKATIKFGCAMLLLCLASSGCTTVSGWFGFGDDDQEEGVQTQPISEAESDQNDTDEDNNVYHASRKELEFKLAKTWARLDELEHRVLRQKQRIKVLERGLMLGIVPEEMKSPEEKAYHNAKRKLPVVVTEPKDLPRQLPKEPKINQRDPKDPTAIILSYDQQLAIAQDYFQQGRYGRAIAEYSELAKDFPQRTSDGSHLYWIALSWKQLREYQTAQQMFTDFTAKYPTSAWLPRASFHLAKTEYALGLRERALAKFKKIIATYPKEDAAEMAKLEISRMEKSL